MSAMKPASAGTPYYVPPEPKRLPSFLLAVFVHAILLFFLWFGISWQSNEPVAVEAEVWDMSVQTAAAPPLPAEPPPEPEPEPEPQPAAAAPRAPCADAARYRPRAREGAQGRTAEEGPGGARREAQEGNRRAEEKRGREKEKRRSGPQGAGKERSRREKEERTRRQEKGG